MYLEMYFFTSHVPDLGCFVTPGCFSEVWDAGRFSGRALEVGEMYGRDERRAKGA
jgi:hypothetical protein